MAALVDLLHQHLAVVVALLELHRLDALAALEVAQALDLHDGGHPPLVRHVLQLLLALLHDLVLAQRERRGARAVRVEELDAVVVVVALLLRGGELGLALDVILDVDGRHVLLLQRRRALLAHVVLALLRLRLGDVAQPDHLLALGHHLLVGADDGAGLDALQLRGAHDGRRRRELVAPHERHRGAHARGRDAAAAAAAGAAHAHAAVTAAAVEAAAIL